MPKKGHKQSEQTKRKRALKLIGNKSRTGQHQSSEERMKKSLALRGEKSGSWKGGNSHPYKVKNAPRPKPIECEICSRQGRICYDHDHKTGKFRGWICLKCNIALGMVSDDPEILGKIIEYINRQVPINT